MELTNINKDMHSPEQLDGLRNSVPAAFFICNIGLYNLCDPALFVNHALCFLRPFDVVVNEGDLCALSGEQNRRCSAVADFA